MSSEHQNLNNFDPAAKPLETNPAEDHDTNTEHKKRNSGRTGPTSDEGKATAARNATRHGMCATTLVMDHEDESEWLNLRDAWLEGYQNPDENSLLYTFVIRTAQAEWHRLRNQKEYDRYLPNHGNPPVTAWEPHEVKAHDLVLRYLTAAERKFQREYRMLEHHWKTHHKPAPEPKPTAKQPDPEPPQKMPKLLFVNNDTGEAVDSKGNHYPPPPDYKPEPIIPGVYGPKHPGNYQPNKKRDSNRR